MTCWCLSTSQWNSAAEAQKIGQIEKKKVNYLGITFKCDSPLVCGHTN